MHNKAFAKSFLAIGFNVYIYIHLIIYMHVCIVSSS